MALRADPSAASPPSVPADTDEATRIYRSQQMCRYLRGVAPLSLGSVALLIALSVVHRSPHIYGLTVLMAVLGGLQARAYVAARAQQVERSVFLQSAGMWTLALGIGMTGDPLYGLAASLTILPVIVAVPYVHPGALARLAVIGTVVMTSIALSVLAGGLVALDTPGSLIRVVVAGGVIANTSACCFSLWHTHYTLDQARSRLSTANDALRRSERDLEQKVVARTEALEASREAQAVARDDALAASRHKSAFLANMSHELRTPLNAVIGFSEVLGAELFGELDERQREYVGDIETSGRSLLGLINDILDLSKIEAGRMEPTLEQVDLATLLAAAVDRSRPLVGDKPIELTHQWPTITLVSDPALLARVVDKVLSNAIKFTEVGSVHVRASSDEDGVQIQVSDTGIGIDEEHRAQIFDAFQSLSGSGTSVGAGVGLTLAHRMVELLGGRIDLQSRRGEGTALTVRLPTNSGLEATES